MVFRASLVYATAKAAKAAAAALPGRDRDCILEADDLVIRGAQIDLEWQNVVGSSFFEGTEVALGALARAAFAGSAYGVYNPDSKPPERESFTTEADAAIPGCPKRTKTIDALLNGALLGSEASVAYAHQRVKPADVPALAAIHDALEDPAHRARIARLLTGRREAAARRITAAHPDLTVPTVPASEPFLVGWVVRQAELGDAARTENARAKVTQAILPMLAARYHAMDSHLARARLVHVLVGRPRIHNRPEVQALIADLLARPIADGADAAELRAIHATATQAARR